MELGGLRRSATSYRRQGSSGLVWDDKLIAEFSRQADAERAERAAAAAGRDPSSSPDAITDTTNLRVKTDVPSSEPGKMRRSHSASTFSRDVRAWSFGLASIDGGGGGARRKKKRRKKTVRSEGLGIGRERQRNTLFFLLYSLFYFLIFL
ncbi:unnamed protein product [Linum tenue]|uniref:Uncharacterized protein n=1 Tax=Linum tenue TaxID=586396 RepID=A0AAV0NL13_9ROSI|nr:unnamed protein product [Linum tenue]